MRVWNSNGLLSVGRLHSINAANVDVVVLCETHATTASQSSLSKHGESHDVIWGDGVEPRSFSGGCMYSEAWF